MLILSLMRPEYFLRPRQALKRVGQFFGFGPNISSVETLELPWNLTILTIPGDELSKAIHQTGIYDLCLTEILWRVIKKGALCVDVGSNIGYATSIMARRATNKGRVVAFEPHPETFRVLSQNSKSWNLEKTNAPIVCHQIGISDHSGARALHIPKEFKNNSGMAHFYEENSNPVDNDNEIEVQCTTLDEFFKDFGSERIDVLKVDIEGHEIQAFKGATQLLKAKRIRNIIFEDSKATWRTPKELYSDYLFLKDSGYSIFRLRRGMLGLKLENLDDLKDDNSSFWREWEPPNFIALADVAETLPLLKRIGWYSLLPN